jgi:hypothetical protein
MNTLQEALFKAMLQEGWFSQSDGDVEFSLGYFGWVHNSENEWFEVSRAFCETIDAYDANYDWGTNIVPDWFAGVYFAELLDTGVIRIIRMGDVTPNRSSVWDMRHNVAVKAARKRFDNQVEAFIEYNNDSGE